MDTDQFRVHGKEMVDYICQYMNTIAERRVVPAVEPNFLRPLLPSEPPMEPEPWENVMQDIESKIMPGVTHWQHPHFHAYFPAGNAYPSIMGEMLCAGIGCIGFSWAACPALTELEVIVLDWIAKAIGLPTSFMSSEAGSKGGGATQGSASECVLVAMLAARAHAIKRLKQKFPGVEEGVLLSKLLAYCSKEAHSCVEKAAMISFVRLRILQPDEDSRLRGETLKKQMSEDEQAGNVPFFVSVTLGTTGSCAFDALDEIGPVVRGFPCVWLHCDAAYAGGSFVCPENRHHMKGIEYADSFNTNPNKFMLTVFDCSLFWVKDKIQLTSTLVVDPLYLHHMNDQKTIDYRHWGIPLSRRFRALKLWFMLRGYGVSGLQKYVRLHCELAKYFESLVRSDSRFEIRNKVYLGLVCFRLKGGPDDTGEQADELNKKLLENINASGKLHMVPAMVSDRFTIRFCVCAERATKQDMDYAWEVISEYATELVEGPDKQRELSAARAKQRLAEKRSYFVRMVSDPKIYNPAITKSTPPVSVGTPASMPPTPDTPIDINCETPTRNNSSWISWPLGFLFNSIDENDLTLRFRHLETTVRLASPSSARRGSTPDPERRPSRFSPRHSPRHSPH